jgi:RNAse (barnase) inhibitor barstar
MKGNIESAKKQFTEAFESFENYIKLQKNNLYKLVKIYPDYIHSFINSNEFKMSELYRKLCEFFELSDATGRNKEKITELATKIIDSGIKLDKNVKFKSKRCEEFYEKIFYPLYCELSNVRESKRESEI